VYKAQYAVGVAEAVCKFGATEPNINQYTLTDCITMAQRASDAGQKFRGHNLIWGNGNPHWLAYGDYDSDELHTIMKNHIWKVVGGLRKGVTPSPVICWDVVNEAVDWNGKQGAFLKTSLPWYPKMHDYVDQAFIVAAKADPNVLLFYNDYCLSVTYDNGAKAQYIADMAATMKKKGIKIDGVGMQMHISTDKDPSRSHTSSIIKKFGAVGLQVHITELDVSCWECKNNNAAALKLQGQIYAD